VLKWALANEAGVVFVLVYNRTIFPSLTYVDEFLQRLKEVRLACLLACLPACVLACVPACMARFGPCLNTNQTQACMGR
jgi:hypothetical protein